MIYLFTFIFSCFFFYCYEESEGTKKKMIFLLLGILAPCFLAAFRADSIGTDVNVYVKPMYEASINSSSIGDYFNQKWYVVWRYMYVSNFEIGFSLIVYILSKLFSQLWVVLFFIQFLIILPIFLGIKKFKKIPVWFGMLVFYLMFYNTSLNMMRQWIAMSFLFFAFNYLLNKDYKKYLSFVILAMFFHVSAIIGLFYLVVFILIRYLNNKNYIFIKSIKDEYKNLVAPFFIAILSIIVLLNLPLIASLLKMIGLDKYAYYIAGEGFGFLYKQLILRLPILILVLIQWVKLCKFEKNAPFLLTILIIDLIISQLSNEGNFRIAAYFSLMNMYIYPTIIYANKSDVRRKRYLMLFFIFYMLIYWFIMYVLKGYHCTYPFIFIGK